MSSTTQPRNPSSHPSTPLALVSASAPEPITKKKFGKNLNKLTKPPAPATGLSGGSANRASANSRNGLLLLSTKRSTSNSASISSSGAGGGLLSGLKSSASSAPRSSDAHDAFLSAAGLGGDAQQATVQQPQAWGLGEASSSPQQQQAPPPILAPKGGQSTTTHHPPVLTLSQQNGSEQRGGNYADGSDGRRSERMYRGQNVSGSPETGMRRSEADIPMNNHHSDSDSAQMNGPNSSDRDQVEYMKQLARERAEKRRLEEEVRMNEQRERAAQRLKELESKISSAPSEQFRNDSSGFQATAGRIAQPRGFLSSHSSIQKSEIILERLGRTNTSNSGDQAGGEETGSSSYGTRGNSRNSGRTLFDPNRTYSSLVGGAAAAGNKDTNKSSNTGNNSKSAPSSNSPQSANKNPSSVSVSANQGTGRGHLLNDEKASVGSSVIQLSSYEDPDRGERKTSSAPRMLFDPKSGSMVSVRAREEATTGGKGGKKGSSKQKPRNSRDKEKDWDDSGKHNANDCSEPKLLKKPKGGRKDDTAALKKERKRGEKNNSSGATETTKSTVDGILSQDIKSGLSGVSSKLPRTCGVLYTVDEKGNYICADGCEADQGYGAHSVPGGRVRNPRVYAQFVEVQQLQSQDAAGVRNEFRLDQHGGNAHISHQQSNASNQMLFGGGDQPQFSKHASLKNRFNVAEATRAERDANDILNQTALNESFGLPLPITVKPNEKIELLCGSEDSPTLQASANPWAPSRAALAAAAAAAANASSMSDSHHQTNIHHQEEEEDDDDVLAQGFDFIIGDDIDEATDDDSDIHNPSLFVGLGFDPTENMDSVMMSPSVKTGQMNGDSGLHLESLSLHGGSHHNESNSLSNNPFGSALLGSSTWASNGPLTGTSSMGSLTNWGILGVSNGETAPPSGKSSGTAEKHAMSATSFLALSPLSVHPDSQTWGTNGLTGLGGTSMTNTNKGPSGSTVD